MTDLQTISTFLGIATTIIGAAWYVGSLILKDRKILSTKIENLEDTIKEIGRQTENKIEKHRVETNQRFQTQGSRFEKLHELDKDATINTEKILKLNSEMESLKKSLKYKFREQSNRLYILEKLLETKGYKIIPGKETDKDTFENKADD